MLNRDIFKFDSYLHLTQDNDRVGSEPKLEVNKI